MLNILYGKSLNELSLCGNEVDLNHFANFIKECDIKKQYDSNGNANPDDYDLALSDVRVQLVEGQQVCFSVDDRCLMISGEKDCLTMLADTISVFSKEFEPGEHIRLEYFDDHWYLGESSCPAVLVKSE